MAMPLQPCRVCGTVKPVNEKCPHNGEAAHAAEYGRQIAEAQAKLNQAAAGIGEAMAQTVEYPVSGAPLIDPLPKADEVPERSLVDMLEDMDVVATSHGEKLLRTFRFEHLPRGPIRSLSAEFAGLATIITEYVPASAERTLALRELWQAKNYAVFAVSDTQRGKPDDDGQIVGAERVREGSSETVVKDATPCLHVWGPDNGLQHACRYEDGHGGRHACIDCGETA